jgi:Lon protease-like protein
LKTVLFPGGPLPLRVFEARYIDMVSDCMKKDMPFGVLLIRSGTEAGAPVTTWGTGTLARIIDWYQGSDGLLGITAIGEQRFRLLSSERQADGLNIGEIELLPEPPTVPMPEDYRDLTTILSDVLDDLGLLYQSLERRFDDAGWVASRFVEILPIDLEEKQQCLENADPLQTLAMIRALLSAANRKASDD